MAVPYKTEYQGKEKKSETGEKYPKDFYNLRSAPKLDQDTVLDEVWRSVHDYLAKEVSGNEGMIGVPFLSGSSSYYPYAVLTKTVKERPKKYTIYPHLSHFVTPQSINFLDTTVGVHEMQDIVFEKKGLTGFGWEDEKGAVYVKITCSGILHFYIPTVRDKLVSLDLAHLNSDIEFLKKNVGDRLYVIGRVFTAGSMTVEVTIDSVAAIYNKGAEDSGTKKAPYMQFVKEIKPDKPQLGIPLCFMVQKIKLDASACKKTFKTQSFPSEGILIDHLALYDNMKFKEKGLWVPCEPHPLDHAHK